MKLRLLGPVGLPGPVYFHICEYKILVGTLRYRYLIVLRSPQSQNTYRSIRTKVPLFGWIVDLKQCVRSVNTLDVLYFLRKNPRGTIPAARAGSRRYYFNNLTSFFQLIAAQILAHALTLLIRESENRLEPVFRIRVRFRSIRNLFGRIRIWILPSTNKKMTKNLDFYCFMTSLWQFILEEWCKCTFKKK